MMKSDFEIGEDEEDVLEFFDDNFLSFGCCYVYIIQLVVKDDLLEIS